MNHDRVAVVSNQNLKMRRRSIKLLGLVLVLLLVGYFAARLFVRSADYTLSETNFTKDALAVVTTHSRLKLPDNAQGLNMVYEGSLGDPAFVAKIEIPADAVDTVKQQIEKCVDEDYNSMGALSEKVLWWNPAQLKVVVERKYTVNSSYVHVLLCQENQHVVLFVESLSF